MPRELWIGMFFCDVTDRCRHFGNATSAGVNAVALAVSEQDFVERVQSALEGIGLACTEIEDVELYQDRVAAFEVDNSIKEAAHRAQDGDVAFGTFHVTDEPRDI